MILRNNKGETLIEVLASILIATLSVALLFTCIMASSRIDDAAQKKDIEHYNAFSGAEEQKTPINPAPAAALTVTITREGAVTATPSIEIYGGEGMYSYKEK